jgi:hypothetical protein
VKLPPISPLLSTPCPPAQSLNSGTLHLSTPTLPPCGGDSLEGVWGQRSRGSGATTNRALVRPWSPLEPPRATANPSTTARLDIEEAEAKALAASLYASSLPTPSNRGLPPSNQGQTRPNRRPAGVHLAGPPPPRGQDSRGARLECRRAPPQVATASCAGSGWAQVSYAANRGGEVDLAGPRVSFAAGSGARSTGRGRGQTPLPSSAAMQAAIGVQSELLRR